jgi:hypothetical protein
MSREELTWLCCFVFGIYTHTTDDFVFLYCTINTPNCTVDFRPCWIEVRSLIFVSLVVHGPTLFFTSSLGLLHMYLNLLFVQLLDTLHRGPIRFWGSGVVCPSMEAHLPIPSGWRMGVSLDSSVSVIRPRILPLPLWMHSSFKKKKKIIPKKKTSIFVYKQKNICVLLRILLTGSYVIKEEK